MAGSKDSDNLQPWTIATVTSVTVLAFIAVSLRILARYEKRQKLWWDDWMIVWSMLWNLLVVGFIFAMLACGMGVHATEVEPAKIVLMAKFLVVAEILYVFNLVWTKLSFLMMFYRIFHFPYFKTWAYIIGTFVILWVICITFLFIFICVPVEKLWYPDLPGKCINQVGTWIANAASTILTDLAILILPIPQVWKLQLRRHQKIALTATFGLGFFVIFASAYRFTVLFSYSALDPTYTLAPTVGWTAIEMSAGITSACLPTLLPAMQFFARKLGIHGPSSFPSFMRSSRNDGTHPTNTIITIGGGEHKGASGVVTPNPDSSKWRPDHGHAYTVSSKGGHSAKPAKSSSEQDSLSGDEVPLHSIRVQTDFRQDENMR